MPSLRQLLCLPPPLNALPPPNLIAAQGVGKTFSLELSLRALGVLPVCLSAGELEDEWAGEPGRRLRERYQFAGGWWHWCDAVGGC
jgi:hypothetical protein